MHAYSLQIEINAGAVSFSGKGARLTGGCQ
jgi:hypothetical protein